MKLSSDKRGVIGIILFFAILFIILIIGFIATIIIHTIDIAEDEVTPIMEDLGVLSINSPNDVNMSHVGEMTFGNLSKVVNALPWLVGFSYIAALIFSVVFVIAFRQNPHPVYIGLYLIMAILLIFGAIIMSNVYENIYKGNNELSTRLHNDVLMSYMILHSPFILTIIIFLTGIYLIARPPEGGDYGL